MIIDHFIRASSILDSFFTTLEALKLNAHLFIAFKDLNNDFKLLMMKEIFML